MSSGMIRVICPCCETKLQVDGKTGEIISLEKKPKPTRSLSDMLKGLDHHQKEQETLFKKRNEDHKERNRILEQKFKEAQKNVDKSGDKPIRDIDLD